MAIQSFSIIRFTTDCSTMCPAKQGAGNYSSTSLPLPVIHFKSHYMTLYNMTQ